MRVKVKAKAIINAVIDGIPTTKFVNEKFEADKEFIDGLLKTAPNCVEIIGPTEKPVEVETTEKEPEAPAKKAPAKKSTAKKAAEKVAGAADDLGLDDGAE